MSRQAVATAGFFLMIVFGGAVFFGLDPHAPRSWIRIGGAGVLTGVLLMCSTARCS